MSLTDERRFEFPVVPICSEFSNVDAKGWVEAGEVPELQPLQNLPYVDFDSGA